jgi:hypothetical protein
MVQKLPNVQVLVERLALGLIPKAFDVAPLHEVWHRQPEPVELLRCDLRQQGSVQLGHDVGSPLLGHLVDLWVVLLVGRASERVDVRMHPPVPTTGETLPSQNLRRGDEEHRGLANDPLGHDEAPWLHQLPLIS